MSAPPRGARDGARGRGSTVPSTRTRGSGRGSMPFQPRGRGRGAPPAANSRAEGLLQGLQAGSLNKRGSDSALARGAKSRGTTSRGSTSSRGQFANNSKTVNAPKPNGSSRSPVPVSSSYKEFMTEINNKYQSLKQKRDGERKEAIANGFLADPEKKTSLDKAITPVGTCTYMCPEFERAERIVQNMVDKSEKIRSDETGRDVPSEERMIKRFRRSAAGYDEQLPSDIRTPVTLKATLDYLLEDVVGGGEKLASVHKFVWDRTRGIRNDFSIQQVTKKEDVRVAVECLERIARFHILSLHQLSNPENLIGEHFDAHQDREQLNNTLLSLIYYYDDNRNIQPFPNEAEFRAYCILFELQSQHPDLEDRMQSWPLSLLKDGRVKTAFKLYASAGSNMFEQGPLRPTTPFSLAQGNSGNFWNVLQSKQVSYLMACVAEIYFGQIRYTTLQSLWTAARAAPITTRARNQDWTLAELGSVLAFDIEEQALEFCEAFGLTFSTNDHGVQYLNVSANFDSLDKSSIPTQQVFSHDIVEAKRYNRTLPAVINGVIVAQAVRLGLVVTTEESDAEAEETDKNSLFIPQKEGRSNLPGQSTRSTFDPQAPAFTPDSFGKPSEPASGVLFNQPTTSTAASLAPSYTFAPTPSTDPATSQPAKSVSLFNNPTATAFGKNAFGSNTQLAPDFQGGKPFQYSGFAPASSNAPLVSPAASLAGSASQPASTDAVPQLPTFSWQKPVDGFQNTATPGDTILFDLRAGTSSAIQPPQSVLVSAPAARIQPVTQSQPPTAFFQSPSPFQFQSPPAQPKPTPQPPFHFQVPSSQSTVPPPIVQSTFNPSFSFQKPSLPPSEQEQQNSTVSPFQKDHSNFPNSEPLSRSPMQAELHSPTHGAAVREDSSFLSFTQAAASPKTSPQLSAGQTTGSTPQANLQDPLFNPYLPSTEVSLPVAPHKSPFTPADREQVIDALAKLAFLQPKGLLDQYMAYIVNGIAERAIIQVTAEKVGKRKRAERRKLLIKKYGDRWRKITWHNLLQRKAKIRRQNFRESMIQEKHKEVEREANLKKMRQVEKEVEEIRKAQEEARAVKAEMLKAEQKMAEESRIYIECLQKKQESLDSLEKEEERSQVAGRKRKSIHVENPEARSQEDTPRKFLKAHKRSRTAADFESPAKLNRWTSHTADLDHNSPPGRYPTPPPLMGISVFSGRRSVFGVPGTNPPRYSNAWQGRPTMDRTQTDYFRLKAMGVDPDTPLVPDTALSLKARQQREEQAKAAAKAKRWIFKSTGRARPPVRKELLAMASPPISSESPPIPSIERSPSVSSPLSASTPNMVKSNDILRQMREVRAQMAEGTEWFKTQTAALAKEIEVQEELRQSAGSNGSPQTNTDGLARSVNGFDYLAPELIPGRKLNPTEQRLRLTGGFGLATKPIGGTPGYKSRALRPGDTAKSNHNALRNNLTKDDLETSEVNLNGSAKRRRKQAGINDSYTYTEPEEDEEEEVELKHLRPRTLSAKGMGNQVADPSQEAEEDGPHDYHHSQGQMQSHLNGTQGNQHSGLGDEEVYSQSEDGDELEEDEEEELIEDEEDDLPDDVDDNLNFNQHDGDDADNEEVGDYDEEDYEEEEYDDGEDEDEEDEEDESQSPQFNYLQPPQMFQQQNDDARRSPFSRGTSGTGMSADDAVVLDSD